MDEKEYNISPDDIIYEEIPYIKKIYEDEIWYESERRGHKVDITDENVQLKVIEIVQRIGAELRQQAISAIIKHNKEL